MNSFVVVESLNIFVVIVVLPDLVCPTLFDLLVKMIVTRCNVNQISFPSHFRDLYYQYQVLFVKLTQIKKRNFQLFFCFHRK